MRIQYLYLCNLQCNTRGPLGRGGIMNAGAYITRRSALNVLGIGIGIALGTGTVTARERGRGERERGEPTFFARLSGNPSIPGHSKVNSRGKGRLDLVGGEQAPFEFELQVRNLTEGATAIHLRGDGSAEGPIWVTLYEGDAINNETISGTIEDGDVDNAVGGVRELIWDELVDGNGVVNVETKFESDGEIAGVVRPRPVAGWIAV